MDHSGRDRHRETGVPLDIETEFTNMPLQDLMEWVKELLVSIGVEVIEVNRPNRQLRRRLGKTDAIHPRMRRRKRRRETPKRHPNSSSRT